MIQLCSDVTLLHWMSGCSIFGGSHCLNLRQLLPLEGNDTILRKLDNHRPSDTVSRTNMFEILATPLRETHFSFYYLRELKKRRCQAV